MAPTNFIVTLNISHEVSNLFRFIKAWIFNTHCSISGWENKAGPTNQPFSCWNWTFLCHGPTNRLVYCFCRLRYRDFEILYFDFWFWQCAHQLLKIDFILQFAFNVTVCDNKSEFSFSKLHHLYILTVWNTILSSAEN